MPNRASAERPTSCTRSGSTSGNSDWPLSESGCSAMKIQTPCCFLSAAMRMLPALRPLRDRNRRWRFRRIQKSSKCTMFLFWCPVQRTGKSIARPDASDFHAPQTDTGANNRPIRRQPSPPRTPFATRIGTSGVGGRRVHARSYVIRVCRRACQLCGGRGARKGQVVSAP